jgi:gamma-glutamyl phosphate reductase
MSAEAIAQAAKAAFESAQLLDVSERVKALHAIKASLEAAKAEILGVNKVDLEVRPAVRMYAHRQ